jgi:dTDP-4-dehydrorhamnose 3,5-epimerase
MPTRLEGAFLVEPEPVADARGFFARVWDRALAAEHRLAEQVEHLSIAYNARAGTLRGMHFQRPPHEEAKVVRCTRGAIHDVIVDLRPSSPTYLEWLAVQLTEENRTSLYVPEGCAHGYQSLVDATEVVYLISAVYAPEAAAGVRWDDPAFGIEWPPADERVLSDRDRSWPDYVPSR